MTKLFKKILIILSLFFLFLGSLPIIAQHILIQQLQKQGLQTKIEDINLNLFLGQFQIINFQETGQQRNRLQIQNLFIDIDWLPLLNKSLSINKIKLAGVKLPVWQKAKFIKIGKITIPLSKKEKADTQSPKTKSAWSVSLKQLIVKNFYIHYQKEQLKLPLNFKYLQLSHVNTAKIAQKNRLAFNLSLNQASIKANILGDFLNPNAQIKTQLSIQQFDFSPYKNLLPAGIKLNKGSMQSNSFFMLQMHQHQPQHFMHRGSLQLNQLDLLYQNKHLISKQLLWQGNSQLKCLKQKTIEIKSNGILSSQKLKLAETNSKQKILVNKALLKTAVSLNTRSIDQSIQLLADATVQQLQLSSLDGNKKVALEKFKLQSAQLNSFNKLNITDITLANLAFQDQNRQVIYHNRQLSLQGIELRQKKQLLVDKITQAAQTVRLEKDKKKQINLSKFLQAFIATKVGKQKTKANSTVTPFYYQIKQFHSEQPNKLYFVDQSVIPEFRQAIELQNITLSNINNFDKQQKMTFQIAGTIKPDGQFSTKGSIQPFADKLNLENVLTAEGIALSGLSSYTLPASGYTIESGDLELKSQLKISQNQVDAQNQLNLHQFTLAEADPKTAETLNSKLSLPLNKALDLLRDEHNSIHLNIPLKGDINNLSVNPNDTINTALANALGTATKVYIATALFPYGTAYTLVKLANEKINAIQLDPVEFVPGKTKLGSKQKDYLNKLGSVLQKKKSLYIRLCAKASQSDKSALIKQQNKSKETKTDWKKVLLQLADKRKNTVKQYLHKNNKIDKKRLVDCRSSIDKEKDGKARVDLLM